MKSICYILLIAIGLFSCSVPNKENINTISKDTFQPDQSNISEKQKLTSNNQVNQTTLIDTTSNSDKDSLPTYFEESLFAPLELQFDSISKKDFEKYNQSSKPTCTISSDGFIARTDIFVDGECKDICESYLVERKSGKKISLPADYDAGILGILMSPSCDKFIVYSSYDGPDYDKYYAYRAELFVFTITKDQGLKAIKPFSKYYSKDWSIEDLTWVNNNSIAIKIYEDHRTGDRSKVEHKYIKAKLNQ